MNILLNESGYTLDGKWRLVPSEYMESLTLPNPPAELAISGEPYAIECGISNGDGTYSVEIERHPLPSYKQQHKDHPVKLLYLQQAPNPPQSLSSWQPIATAPKDGTDILVMTGETMHVARWENVHGDFDYWVVDDNKHGPFTLRGKEPTHWMPLPETVP